MTVTTTNSFEHKRRLVAAVRSNRTLSIRQHSKFFVTGGELALIEALRGQPVPPWVRALITASDASLPRQMRIAALRRITNIVWPDPWKADRKLAAQGSEVARKRLPVGGKLGSGVWPQKDGETKWPHPRDWWSYEVGARATRLQSGDWQFRGAGVKPVRLPFRVPDPDAWLLALAGGWAKERTIDVQGIVFERDVRVLGMWDEQMTMPPLTAKGGRPYTLKSATYYPTESLDMLRRWVAWRLRVVRDRLVADEDRQNLFESQALSLDRDSVDGTKLLDVITQQAVELDDEDVNVFEGELRVMHAWEDDYPGDPGWPDNVSAWPEHQMIENRGLGPQTTRETNDVEALATKADLAAGFDALRHYLTGYIDSKFEPYDTERDGRIEQELSEILEDAS